MEDKLPKVFHRLSTAVLLLAFLSVFAHGVKYVHDGGEALGVFTKPFKSFIDFPSLMMKAFNQQGEKPAYHVSVKKDFSSVNKLDEDLFSVNARFHEDQYIFELKNLRNDSILHSWYFSLDQFNGPRERFLVAHPQNPILLEDGSIVGMFYGTNNLFRLDKDSKIIWHNTEKRYHHSLNLAPDGNVWACAWGMGYTKNEVLNETIKFKDEYLTKVDIETGEIIFQKSMAEILIDNGYVNMVHGYGNEASSKGTDFFHMNDIQPVLTDGPYWKKGDLLLSLRHRSAIIQYRPYRNEVVRIIEGPFLSQHDVDITSDSTISIFNNNRAHTRNKMDKGFEGGESLKLTLSGSDIVAYDFSDSTFTKPYLAEIQKEEIFTYAQGTHTILSNGDLFIEATESGRIYVFRDGEVIYRDYPNATTEQGTTEYPHWMRIYEHVDFK